MKSTVFVQRSVLAVGIAFACAQPALAHHGFGLYQIQIPAEWSGTLTRMELVNPHSYMYFDTIDKDGNPISMRCEMRAATLIKRSGWSFEQFVPGSHVEIKGHPHRDDPHACYVESFTLNEGPEISRNDQLSVDSPVDISNRPLRLADGELNISGDWAVEQSVLTIPPSGGHGSMIPKSLTADFASGKLSMEQIQAMQPPRPKVVYTPAGEAAAKAFDNRSPEDNPWFACKPTSFIRDWTADWPINQFKQTTTAEGEKVLDITYGLYSFKRRIHIGMDQHPDNLEPSYAGHSIGHWEGDTLVVDTVGFSAGVLTPPTRNSVQMHIVERFSLDTQKMALKREYSVTDPVYLAAPYASYDVMYLSDVPFEEHPCKELTPEFEQ